MELSARIVTPAAAIRGPPIPRSVAAGSSRIISAASEAAAMSPETSPATMKMLLPLSAGLSHVHPDQRNASLVGNRYRLVPVEQQRLAGFNRQHGGTNVLQ